MSAKSKRALNSTSGTTSSTQIPRQPDVIKRSPTPAFAYIRVSTEDQAENFSPESQEKAIRAYAQANGFHIARVFFDADSGDLPIEARLNGRAKRAALRKGEAKAILVLCLDRLSRNEVHSHVIWQDWVRRGIELHFVQGGKQENTPEARLTFAVTAGVAAYERAKILERTRRGRRAKVERGQWLGQATAPYGYARTGEGRDSGLEVCEAEARILRRIFEWFVWGDPAGGAMSLRQIAVRLNEMGVPTHTVARGRGHSVWRPVTIRQMLKNELYYGEYIYGKTTYAPKQYDTQKNHEREMPVPEAQWLRVPMPELAIVNRGLWDAAQRKLVHNREMRNRKRFRNWLLSGFLRCPHCGRCMSGARSGRHKYKNGNVSPTYFLYVCWNEDCIAYCKYKSAKLIEERLWQRLVAELEPRRVAAGLAELRRHRAEGTLDRRNHLNSLEREIEVEARKVTRLAGRIAALEGQMDESLDAESLAGLSIQLEALQTQLHQDSRLLAGLKAERQKLLNTLEHLELTAEREQEIIRMARALHRRTRGEPAFEQKRSLMESIELEVRLDLVDERLSMEMKWSFGAGVEFSLKDEDKPTSSAQKRTAGRDRPVDVPAKRSTKRRQLMYAASGCAATMPSRISFAST
jgi:site-specific DNA recombinase